MKLWIFLLLATLSSGKSHAIEMTLFRVAAQESSEPKFIVSTHNGKSTITGFCVDIFRAIEKIDPTIQFSGDQAWQPRARIDNNLKSGALDVICGVQHIERFETIYEFIDTPLFTVNYLLAARTDDSVEVNSWDDIRKLGKDGIILTMHGFGIVDILEDIGGLTIDSGGTTPLSNLKKLLAGRGRFYCHRSPGIKTDILKAGMGNKVRLIDKLQFSEKLYMATSKYVPNRDRLRIRTALNVLQANGELKRLMDKYQE
ncbi:substrate-binding periplasmic protein [Undibacterium sp. Xuan67W]|uniref:substrate-binding periplasmic protein n=1 Tax=Undibacterium sp. Xuan67W TaxID=3413057 RepID=UPI003BF0D693